MKKAIMIVMMMLVVVSQVGCASYAMYGSNKAQVQARGEQEPSVMQVIKENPWSTAAAAVIDGALAYGAYEGIRSIDSGSDSKSDAVEQRGDTANRNSAGDNVTIVQGNGNQVNITTTPVQPVEFAPQEE